MLTWGIRYRKLLFTHIWPQAAARENWRINIWIRYEFSAGARMWYDVKSYTVQTMLEHSYWICETIWIEAYLSECIPNGLMDLNMWSSWIESIMLKRPLELDCIQQANLLRHSSKSQWKWNEPYIVDVNEFEREHQMKGSSSTFLMDWWVLSGKQTAISFTRTCDRISMKFYFFERCLDLSNQKCVKKANIEWIICWLRSATVIKTFLKDDFW